MTPKDRAHYPGHHLACDQISISEGWRKTFSPQRPTKNRLQLTQRTPSFGFLRTNVETVTHQVARMGSGSTKEKETISRPQVQKSFDNDLARIQAQFDADMDEIHNPKKVTHQLLRDLSWMSVIYHANRNGSAASPMRHAHQCRRFSALFLTYCAL